jgi:hypothetical protein
MGVDYHSYALMGLRIPASKLHAGLKKVKRFEHDHPESMIYCPQTGKKLWRDEKVLVDGLVCDEDGEIEIPEFPQYEVLWDTENENLYIAWMMTGGTSSNDREYVKLGFGEGTAYDANSEAIQFEVDMTKLGLWDEAAYGLYSVLNCLY